jgi:hypothetical protein
MKKNSARTENDSERITLPTPAALAQIAASFGMNDHPDTSIKAAVRLLLRATAFIEKHDKTTLIEMAEACDDKELLAQLHEAALLNPMCEKLRFETDKTRDEVRDFFANEHAGLKTAKAIWENLREFHRLLHAKTFLRDRNLSSEENETFTQLERDDRVVQMAENNGWREEQADSDFRTRVEQAAERQNDGREIYRFDKTMLGALVNWKKSRKRSGGLRSVRTAKRRETRTAA